MYDVKKIEDAFFPIVGWEQSIDPYKQIDPALTTTLSGETFQGQHPLLTLENLRRHAPDFRQYGYPEYSASREYLAGNRVGYNNDVWEALQDTYGNTPEEGSEYWQEVDVFSSWLEKETRTHIRRSINQYVSRRMEKVAARNLLERRQFFNGVGNPRNVIQSRGKLVGFEFRSKHSYGVTIKVERIGVQFSGPCSFNLYVFHSSQLAPQRVIPITVTGIAFEWHEFEDLYLPYMDDGINGGGAWFICYDQTEIPVGTEAIDFGGNWRSCGTCANHNRAVWDLLSANMDVNTYSAPRTTFQTESKEIFDIEDVCYTNETNYGLNFQLTVGCDITEFMVSNRMAFKMLIAKQVAVAFLRFMAYNPEVRINRNQANIQRHEYLYEIDGNTAGRPTGIMYELEQEYKAVNVDTSGIDRVCLPCQNYGVKIRGI